MLFDQYDEIICDQLVQEIVERIPNGQPNKRESCLPHRSVIREMAEMARIVFDASARENNHYL